MSKEIQDTTFSISLKTLFSICAFLFLLIGEYIVLQKDINEAKSLPKAQVTKIEFEYSNEKLQDQINFLKKELESLKK
tara:strand:+ start:3823 stop:4056 length:234 start_codon:yes stop_codon:yes gene_type:complete